MLTNPPYGERLSDKEEVKYLYRCLGRTFRDQFAGWTLSYFTANPDLAEMVGVQWLERQRLFNGPIKCQLLTGKESLLVEKPTHEWTLTPPITGSPGEDFANRLLKNWSTLEAWIKAENISCFRLYDADIPEFNLAIDLYEGWIHVQEYAPPPEIDAQKAEQRFTLALQVIRTLFSAPRSQLFIKTRKKQKGAQQYQKKPGSGELYEVREGGARFLVNFTDYLDTGLFLDHRITRAKLGQLSQGKTFLNLFAYTGTATVYAAMGGATATTTVDISDTYLARARANLALNGYGGPLHQTVEADCLEWLKTANERFGVIFVDPPTFSNSRHRKQVFDVQKDHAPLLRLALRRLAKGGMLVFSTNSRKFILDEALAREFDVREISAETIPFDFQRNRRIHRCWEIQHQQEPLTTVEAGS
jgi:23S rRNA (guanine2445-N2)-methyltransferase / 23S rRNA (guanine2069-N7)-methyltransferase